MYIIYIYMLYIYTYFYIHIYIYIYICIAKQQTMNATSNITNVVSCNLWHIVSPKLWGHFSFNYSWTLHKVQVQRSRPFIAPTPRQNGSAWSPLSTMVGEGPRPKGRTAQLRPWRSSDIIAAASVGWPTIEMVENVETSRQHIATDRIR